MIGRACAGRHRSAARAGATTDSDAKTESTNIERGFIIVDPARPKRV
jgi:hypothetical protein